MVTEPITAHGVCGRCHEHKQLVGHGYACADCLAALEAACTCYLGDPSDPTRSPEACGPCDTAFWLDPVFVIVDVDGA